MITIPVGAFGDIVVELTEGRIMDVDGTRYKLIHVNSGSSSHTMGQITHKQYITLELESFPQTIEQRVADLERIVKP